MKVNIFPLVSSLHNESKINENTARLLSELMSTGELEFRITPIEELYDGDLALILVQSGGSEGLFLERFNSLKAPFYLLTYGNNNSLPASLEILSYLKDNNLEGEVLHGSNAYIVGRIKELTKCEATSRLGVVGKPSDWLIASNVNYESAKRLHGVELVDIPIERVIGDYHYQESVNDWGLSFNYDKAELDKALRLHKVLESLKEEYNLSGLTIRCFDLLGTIGTTACLSLALLNQEGTVATCEGDVPAMISMEILSKILGKPSFQANPSRIDVKGNKIVFAHCTLPLNMVKDYYLDTHFESGIGVAIKGYLNEERVTIFKLSRNLKDYFVTTGTIVRNLEEDNLCRTQIEVRLDEGTEYFLTRPYGNHHVILYGDHKEDIVKYMKNVK